MVSEQMVEFHVNHIVVVVFVEYRETEKIQSHNRLEFVPTGHMSTVIVYKKTFYQKHTI